MVRDGQRVDEDVCWNAVVTGEDDIEPATISVSRLRDVLAKIHKTPAEELT